MIEATLFQGKEMLDTVLYSLGAGVGLTLVFALAIWGTTRLPSSAATSVTWQPAERRRSRCSPRSS